MAGGSLLATGSATTPEFSVDFAESLQDHCSAQNNSREIKYLFIILKVRKNRKKAQRVTPNAHRLKCNPILNYMLKCNPSEAIEPIKKRFRLETLSDI